MRDEREFTKKIAEAGGSLYIAGGFVRDKIMGRAPQDKDYVITGLDTKIFAASFPDAIRVGKHFPVYLIEVGGKKCEAAFARRERKCGRGYLGFKAVTDPSVTIEEDLYRRDTTVNSMALSLPAGELIDPYGGKEDIGRKILRATSEHFGEDPVRALRAARQAAQLGFTIDPATLFMMRRCAGELKDEPEERKTEEMKKALGSDKPSMFFKTLSETGLLEAAYPHISAIFEAEAGGVKYFDTRRFREALTALDESAKLTERTEVRYAALFFASGSNIRKLSSRSVPNIWRKCARFALCEARSLPETSEDIAELLSKLETHPLGADGFAVLLSSSGSKVPPYIEKYDEFSAALKNARGKVSLHGAIRGAEAGRIIRRAEISALRELMKG